MQHTPAQHSMQHRQTDSLQFKHYHSGRHYQAQAGHCSSAGTGITKRHAAAGARNCPQLLAQQHMHVLL